ncbi:MAG: hypothetical protein JWN04_5530 [Myxococcaceae bacterium]|nr:hypothetical protein [Myxococcaceae bacterium]
MTYHSDPTRWTQSRLSSNDGAPEFLRDAFQAGAHEGPSDLQMRTLALKLAAVGTGAALAAGATTAHASATAAGKAAAGGAFGAIKAGGALTLSKIAVSLALVGAAATGAVYLQRSSAPQSMAPAVQQTAAARSPVLAAPAATLETLRAPVAAPSPAKNTAVAVASLDKSAPERAAAARVHEEKLEDVAVGQADEATTGSSSATRAGDSITVGAGDSAAVKSHHAVRQERHATAATSRDTSTAAGAASEVNKSTAAPRVSAERVAGQRQQLSEIELLRSARSALAAHPREAYRLAEEHKALYPQGVFAQERDALAVEALQRSGDLKLARQLAEAFVQRYPSSPHAHRFRETMNLP